MVHIGIAVQFSRGAWRRVVVIRTGSNGQRTALSVHRGCEPQCDGFSVVRGLRLPVHDRVIAVGVGARVLWLYITTCLLGYVDRRL